MSREEPELTDDVVALHQVHPVKLGADISASALSNALPWRHRLGAGLPVRLGLPVFGSAVVLGFGEVETLRDSAAGRYVLANMPPSAVAVRLGGDVIMAFGAWRRSPRLMCAGLAVVLVGWSHGLLRPRSETRAR
jgi:hypothetical protein